MTYAERMESAGVSGLVLEYAMCFAIAVIFQLPVALVGFIEEYDGCEAAAAVSE